MTKQDLISSALREFDKWFVAEYGRPTDIETATIHENIWGAVEPLISQAYQAGVEEERERIVKLLWGSHRSEPEPDDEDKLNPGLGLAIFKIGQLPTPKEGRKEKE